MTKNWQLLKTIGANPKLLKPLGNYIVIQLFEAEKESMGGIALPSQVVDKDKQSLARVLVCGPGQRALLDAKPVGLFVEEGDLIVILKHTPIEIKLGGEVCHVIAEGDIVAKVDEEELNKLLENLPEEQVEEGQEEVDPMVQTESGIWVMKETK